MSNCVYCKKQILTKFIFSLLDLKSKEIQMALNISKSVVSRYLTGERRCPEIDLYIIGKIFGIKFTPKLITQDYCFVRALILMNIETAFSGL